MKKGLVTLLPVLVLLAATPSASAFDFTKTDYAVETAPSDIDIGDLDGANGPDIVYSTAVAGQDPDGRVVRRLNLGAGNFGAAQTTESCNFGYELILHNFTPSTDSNLDALTTCGTLRGDGAGNFTTPPDPTNNPSIQEAMTLAQIQPGGNPELVYGGPNTGSTNRICFSLWSSPDFGSPICGNPTSPDPPFSFSNQPRPFRRFSFAGTNAVPLDNEPAGDPPRDDIITESNESSDKINIYGRDPSVAVGGMSYAYQAWSDATRTTSAGPANRVTGIASGDVNGDGTTDVLVSNDRDTDPRFDLFIWDPAVGLATTPAQTPTIMRPEEIVVRDFDGDGLRDVALANGIGQLALHAGNGDGTFDAPEIFPLTGGNGNVDLVVGDVSGDGKPDIVAAEARIGGGTLAVFINGTEAPVPPVGPGPPGTPPITPITPFVPDTKPPATTITRGPKPEIKSSKATFKFKSDEPGSKFECKLDKNPYSACSSPEKLAKLGVGKHKFAVRAIDAAGNVDPTPARGKFKVVDK